MAKKKVGLLDIVPERLLPLSETEVALCRAAEKFGWAYFDKSGKCLDGDAEGDPEDLDPNPSTAKDLPVIRAEVVAWLLTDKKAHEHMTHNGLTICGARIEGRLNASFAVFPWRFRLFRCFVPNGMLIQNAEFGLLNFGGSHVHGGQTAIDADGIKVKGDVFLRDGFSAVGMVRFLGADVGGGFVCTKGSFRAKPEGQELASTDRALNADRIKVKEGVFLNDGFSVVGEVRFLGADVGGNFECGKGKFLNRKSCALTADRIKVKGSVFLNGGFSAKGEVRFPGANVGGIFILWINLEPPPRIDGKLNLHTATIHGKLSLIKTTWGDKGAIDLSHASASVLWDKKDSWPGMGQVNLSGFTYERIERGSPISPTDRLDWLALQHEEPFSPQPYEQLAKVYRESGHEVEAKAVLFEKSDRAHRLMAEEVKSHLKHPSPLLFCILELFVRSIIAFCVFLSCRFTAMFHAAGWQAKLSALCSGGIGEEGNLNGYPWGRVTEWVWGDVLRFTVGYGYKPRLVWRCFALFLGTGTLLFWLLSPAMTTAAQNVYTNKLPAMEHGTNNELPGTEYWDKRHADASMKGTLLADAYPHFNAFLYSLDTFIPLVDLNLNQKKYWYPDSNKPVRAFILYTYLIFHTTAGWVLVSLLAASLAGVIKK